MIMEVDELLTTTRSARKALDLDAPVEPNAIRNFQLALHSRGYGTCITTLHLAHEKAVRGLLGIPDTYTQGCLLPVARLRAGRTFRPAVRRPIEEVVAVDTWEGPSL